MKQTSLFMQLNKLTFIHFIYFAAAAFALSPWVNSGEGLLMGILLALVLGNPFLELNKRLTHQFLGISVIGLGAGMNLAVIGQVGFQGIGYTVIGISVAIAIGTFLGKKLHTPKDTSLLITIGTAICGGSAIAAVAPVIRAKSHEVSVALGIVFLLNAIALFIFPAIGHYFSLTQSQFGLWCALAIHDTSSVVGASLQYGAEALEIGTTVKLARALWIVPVAFLVGYIRSRNATDKLATGKGKKPWFILGFILAAALVTWIPTLQPLGHQIEGLAKHLLVLTLFLIGSSLTLQTLKSVGFKPFIQGTLLWIIMAAGSLFVIATGWVKI